MSRRRQHFRWAGWLVLAPFFLFGLAFEILPVLTLVRSSFTADGGWSLANFGRAFTPVMLASFRNSVQLAASTALLGVAGGTLVAYAIVTAQRPVVRDVLTALADVTANFGGAPLAFAFIITLGSTGVVTLLLKAVGVSLYPSFRIYSVSGLTIAYVYFQLPLMILLIGPALLGGDRGAGFSRRYADRNGRLHLQRNRIRLRSPHRRRRDVDHPAFPHRRDRDSFSSR